MGSESRDSLTETLSAASFNDEEHLETSAGEADRLRLSATIPPVADKRLVTWNVDILSKLLKQIIARRRSRKNLFTIGEPSQKTASRRSITVPSRNNLLDEVVDVLALPHFDEKLFKNHVDPNTIELPIKVTSQLNDFVSTIAAMYNNSNPFHSFEHARVRFGCCRCDASKASLCSELDPHIVFLFGLS